MIQTFHLEFLVQDTSWCLLKLLSSSNPCQLIHLTEIKTECLRENHSFNTKCCWHYRFWIYSIRSCSLIRSLFMSYDVMVSVGEIGWNKNQLEPCLNEKIKERTLLQDEIKFPQVTDLELPEGKSKILDLKSKLCS